MTRILRWRRPSRDPASGFYQAETAGGHAGVAMGRLTPIAFQPATFSDDPQRSIACVYAALPHGRRRPLGVWHKRLAA